MNSRVLQRTIPGQAASDGAGVRLLRSLGAGPFLRLDPFLMLDEFSSENPDDYVAGFPPHPHRGFETVTYMLDGRMRHEDNLGHRGDLGPGDVQWMRAARGIVHSEMPQQDRGRMRGFQLWVNLPAARKMEPAAYRDIPAAQIPSLPLDGGGLVRVIRGQWRSGAAVAIGPVEEPSAATLYADVHLPAHGRLSCPTAAGDNAFVYLYEGEASVGADGSALPVHGAGVLGPGDVIDLVAGAAGARLLVLCGTPLNEPVVQYGPFVMNTRAQIEQAIEDYQAGRLGRA